jgi:protocatechuate 3,4-dioxygenase beta subunit
VNETRWRESGASEVIGAVLLVGLVVIGGAVVATFVFGQPTPKAVPHVSFGVSLDDTDTLVLHHNGGDTLIPKEYGVYVYYTDGTLSEATDSETSVAWSSGGALPIGRDPDKRVGHVVLAFKDGSGGETVLRRVPLEDVGAETHTPEPTTTVTLTSIPTATPTILPGSGYISGFKWNDLDGDHKWNDGEPPLAGWTISAEVQSDGSSWDEAGSATTDADGFYTITGLSEGHYRVFEVQQAGWEQTYPTDSNGFHNVDLNNGHPFMDHQDFGNHQVATPAPSPSSTPTVTPTPTGTYESGIQGMKYNDHGADHKKDAGDEGLPGWTIFLERQEDNGSDWIEVGRTVTDANGNYAFTNLQDGHYRAYEVEQPGWERTYPTDSGGWQNFVINNGRVNGPDTKRDFGNHKVGLIAGRKYSDQNANHQYDPGEPHLPGWTIQLYRQSGSNWNLVVSATTDAEGVYQFSDVANGNYRVAEVQQSNWYQTAPTTYEGTHLVTISDAQKHVTGLDFGNYNSPIAGYGNYMVLNNPHNSAVMHDGDYIQFCNHGTWDYVTIGGQRIDVPADSTVKLAINGDQTTGKIYMYRRQVSTFSFNARLYIDGQLRGSGWISEIWFAGTDPGAGVDQFVTNIHYLMPQQVSGMQFTVDDRQIINPPWWPYTNWGVSIYNFAPASHPGGWEDTVLNLDFHDGTTYLVCSGWYEVIK